MEKYPFVSCLQPNRIVNPHTKEVVVAPCGKCEVCAQRKSGLNTLKCELESQSHNYTMFVTLTYSDEYVPLCGFESNTRFIPNFSQEQLDSLPFKPSDDSLYRTDKKHRHGYYVFNVTERKSYQYAVGEILDIYYPDHVGDVQKLKAKFNLGGYIPYLNKRDGQLFLKRLRKRLNEKIRFYLVGEYGPIHYRPHFHLLLWFDQNETLWNIHEAISKSWTYGRIDASLSNGRCASYVASYVNSSCYLPKVLKMDFSRPFANHSYFLGEQYLQKSKKEVYEDSFENFIHRGCQIGSSYTDVSVWRSLKTIFFPKCKGYAQKSDMERYYSYRLYGTASNATGENSPYRQAKVIASYIKEKGFDHHDLNIDKMLKYFFTSLKIKLLELHTALDYDWLLRSIYMELRLSNHFMMFVRPYFKSTEKALQVISEFYKFEDYENLKEWYKNQEEYFFLYWDSFPDMKLWYDNFEQYELEENIVYNQFKSYRLHTYKESVKHKELNDANFIFNNM